MSILPRLQRTEPRARLLGSGAWLPLSFRTRHELLDWLPRSCFDWIDFGDTFWLIAPDGAIIEIRMPR